VVVKCVGKHLGEVPLDNGPSEFYVCNLSLVLLYSNITYLCCNVIVMIKFHI
jgi:hypothetical protein